QENSRKNFFLSEVFEVIESGGLGIGRKIFRLFSCFIIGDGRPRSNTKNWVPILPSSTLVLDLICKLILLASLQQGRAAQGHESRDSRSFDCAPAASRGRQDFAASSDAKTAPYSVVKDRTATSSP